MATIAKKCNVCGKMYKAYNYVEITESSEDEEPDISGETSFFDYEVLDYQPNGFEFVTIKEDMDIQYDFDNQDLCPECMAVISNFIDTNTPHASGNPVILEDAAPGTPIEMVVDIQPSQDLHGYDHPWVGGAGKNKLPNNWSSATVNGINFTVNEDGTVTANGTATANATFYYDTEMAISQNMIMNGCPSDGSASKYVMLARTTTNGYRTDDGSGVTIKNGLVINRFAIVINSGQTVNNLEFKPMLRLASETDTSYAPYENICPITGYDEVNVKRTGKNLLDSPKITKTENMALVDGVFVAQPISQGNQIVTLKFSDTAFVGTPVSISFDVWGDGIAEFRFDGQPDAINAGGTDFSDKTVNVSTSKKRLTFSGTFLAGTTSFRIFRTSSYLGAGTVTVNISNIQIERGSTPTSYEPYQSQSVTVTLNDTTYGGTLNMGTGELVVTYGVVDLGTLRWGFESTNNVFQTSTALVKTGSEGTPIICDRYVARPYGYNGSYSTEDKIIYVHAGSGTLRVRDSAYTDATSFKNAVNGVQLVYELIKPITYNLTPAQIRLLKGSNTIETDAGTLTIKYKKAIEGKMEVES